MPGKLDRVFREDEEDEEDAVFDAAAAWSLSPTTLVAAPSRMLTMTRSCPAESRSTKDPMRALRQGGEKRPQSSSLFSDFAKFASTLNFARISVAEIRFFLERGLWIWLFPFFVSRPAWLLTGDNENPQPPPSRL